MITIEQSTGFSGFHLSARASQPGGVFLTAEIIIKLESSATEEALLIANFCRKVAEFAPQLCGDGLEKAVTQLVYLRQSQFKLEIPDAG